MKHFLLFFSLLLVGGLTSFAADSTDIALYKQIKADVGQTLSQTFNALEGPAKHAYEVTVAQQKVDAVITLLCYPVGLLIAVGFMIFFIKLDNKRDRYTNDYAGGCCFSGILAAILFIVCVALVPNAIGRLYNPEYYAIKELLEVVK